MTNASNLGDIFIYEVHGNFPWKKIAEKHCQGYRIREHLSRRFLHGCFQLNFTEAFSFLLRAPAFSIRVLLKDTSVASGEVQPGSGFLVEPFLGPVQTPPDVVGTQAETFLLLA